MDITKERDKRAKAYKKDVVDGMNVKNTDNLYHKGMLDALEIVTDNAYKSGWMECYNVMNIKLNKMLSDNMNENGKIYNNCFAAIVSQLQKMLNEDE